MSYWPTRPNPTSTDRRSDHKHQCRRLGDGNIGGDGRRGGAQSPLPGEEVGAIEVVVAIGIAVTIEAEVALPLGEVFAVDGAVAVEVAGQQARRGSEGNFAGSIQVGEIPRVQTYHVERSSGRHTGPIEQIE